MSYFYLPLLPIGEIKRAKALIGDGISVSRKGVKAVDHDLLQDGGVGDGEVGGRHVILTPHLAKPELNCHKTALSPLFFFLFNFHNIELITLRSSPYLPHVQQSDRNKCVSIVCAVR